MKQKRKRNIEEREGDVHKGAEIRVLFPKHAVSHQKDLSHQKDVSHQKEEASSGSFLRVSSRHATLPTT